jgi:hypothetical protein
MFKELQLIEEKDNSGTGGFMTELISRIRACRVRAIELYVLYMEVRSKSGLNFNWT